MEEQGTQEVLVEQGHANEMQQKTYHISSFSEDDEIFRKSVEMERHNEEEKGLLMSVVKGIRFYPERIPANLRYIDMNKVRAATVTMNKTISLIKTEKITEAASVLYAAGNIIAEMVGYNNKEMTGNK